MDDLISRQAAIDALGEKPSAWTEGEYELGLQNQWQSDIDALKDLPSAEPEQRKGEWVDGNGKDTFIHCSVCDKEAYWDTDYGQQEFDFCPYCGADMRGDQ